jgi:hypothetical protein
LLTFEKLKIAIEMLPEMGDENFYIVVHPETAYRLKVMEARYKYYLERHIQRLEKRYAAN